MTIEMKVTAIIGSEGATLNVTFEGDYKLLDVMNVVEMVNSAVLGGIQKYTAVIVKDVGRKLTKKEIDQIIANTTIGEIGF